MLIPVSEGLRPWATTPSQLDTLNAVINAGSVRGAARLLGKHPKTISETIDRIKARAAKAGFSPEHDMVRPVPEGYSVRGVSTYYDGEGNVKGQWVKSRAEDEEREERIREAYEAMAQELPKVEPRPVPADVVRSDKLVNLFTITDYHMGMLAWHKETGADWDLHIAENMLYRSFEQLLVQAPAAKTAIINQLGDFLHTDGLEAKTPLHGHLLDADGRFPKIVAATIRVLRRVVDLALETHDHVHVIMAEGNHDIVSSIWLRVMFKAIYENEPRVTVDDSPYPYYIYRHGQTLLAFHHGHLSRNESLPGLFAAKFRKEWGESTRTYIHTGHRHHQQVKEHPGALVVQHATLAAPDAYAARGGWFSERQAKCITYHIQHGEVGSHVVTPEMVDF